MEDTKVHAAEVDMNMVEVEKVGPVLQVVGFYGYCSGADSQFSTSSVQLVG